MCDMAVALLILLVATVGGTILTYAYLQRASPAVRTVGGAITGLTVMSTVGYVYAWHMGLTAPCMALTLITTATPLLLLGQCGVRERIRQEWAHPLAMAGTPTQKAATVLCILALSVLVVVTMRQANYQRQEEGYDVPSVFTADDNNISDLPMHVAITTSLVWGHNFPTQDIELNGVRLAYPMLVDFQASQLMTGGLDFTPAMFLQGAFLALLFAAVVGIWGWEFLRDRRAALLFPWLVLLNGGLGFCDLWPEIQGHLVNLPHVLMNLEHNYTITDGWLRWGNTLTVLMVPQRGFLLSIPLLMWVMILLWRAIHLPAGAQRNRLASAAGAFAGLDVLVHSYTALVALGMGFLLAFLFVEWKSWLRFGLWALGTAGPELAWLLVGTAMHPKHFVGFEVGWDRNGKNPILFWLVNTGLFLPLLAAGLFHHRDPETNRRRRFYLPFLLCFIVPNLLRLAPWIWDNIKILSPWFIFSAPWVAWLVADVTRRGVRGIVAGVLLIGLLTASGAIDVWRVFTHVTEQRIFDGDQVEFARELADLVPPDAVVLHLDTHNSPIYICGRQTVLGYPPHVDTRGLDAGTRSADIRAIYEGHADAPRLLARYNVDYIAVTPEEAEAYKINNDFLNQYPKLLEWRGFRLYQVARP